MRKLNSILVLFMIMALTLAVGCGGGGGGGGGGGTVTPVTTDTAQSLYNAAIALVGTAADQQNATKVDNAIAKLTAAKSKSDYTGTLKTQIDQALAMCYCYKGQCTAATAAASAALRSGRLLAPAKLLVSADALGTLEEDTGVNTGNNEDAADWYEDAYDAAEQLLEASPDSLVGMYVATMAGSQLCNLDPEYIDDVDRYADAAEVICSQEVQVFTGATFDDDDFRSWHGEGWLYAGNSAEAVKIFDEIDASDPRRAFGLGRAYLAMNNLKYAYAYLVQVVAANVQVGQVVTFDNFRRIQEALLALGACIQALGNELQAAIDFAKTDFDRRMTERTNIDDWNSADACWNSFDPNTVWGRWRQQRPQNWQNIYIPDFNSLLPFQQKKLLGEKYLGLAQEALWRAAPDEAIEYLTDSEESALTYFNQEIQELLGMTVVDGQPQGTTQINRQIYEKELGKAYLQVAVVHEMWYEALVARGDSEREAGAVKEKAIALFTSLIGKFRFLEGEARNHVEKLTKAEFGFFDTASIPQALQPYLARMDKAKRLEMAGFKFEALAELVEAIKGLNSQLTNEDTTIAAYAHVLLAEIYFNLYQAAGGGQNVQIPVGQNMIDPRAEAIKILNKIVRVYPKFSGYAQKLLNDLNNTTWGANWGASISGGGFMNPFPMVKVTVSGGDYAGNYTLLDVIQTIEKMKSALNGGFYADNTFAAYFTGLNTFIDPVKLRDKALAILQKLEADILAAGGQIPQGWDNLQISEQERREFLRAVMAWVKFNIAIVYYEYAMNGPFDETYRTMAQQKLREVQQQFPDQPMVQGIDWMIQALSKGSRAESWFDDPEAPYIHNVFVTPNYWDYDGQPHDVTIFCHVDDPQGKTINRVYAYVYQYGIPRTGDQGGPLTIEFSRTVPQGVTPPFPAPEWWYATHRVPGDVMPGPYEFKIMATNSAGKQGEIIAPVFIDGAGTDYPYIVNIVPEPVQGGGLIFKVFVGGNLAQNDAVKVHARHWIPGNWAPVDMPMLDENGLPVFENGQQVPLVKSLNPGENAGEFYICAAELFGTYVPTESNIELFFTIERGNQIINGMSIPFKPIFGSGEASAEVFEWFYSMFNPDNPHSWTRNQTQTPYPNAQAMVDILQMTWYRDGRMGQEMADILMALYDASNNVAIAPAYENSCWIEWWGPEAGVIHGDFKVYGKRSKTIAQAITDPEGKVIIPPGPADTTFQTVHFIDWEFGKDRNGQWKLVGYDSQEPAQGGSQIQVWLHTNRTFETSAAPLDIRNTDWASNIPGADFFIDLSPTQTGIRVTGTATTGIFSGYQSPDGRPWQDFIYQRGTPAQAIFTFTHFELANFDEEKHQMDMSGMPIVIYDNWNASQPIDIANIQNDGLMLCSFPAPDREMTFDALNMNARYMYGSINGQPLPSDVPGGTGVWYFLNASGRDPFMNMQQKSQRLMFFAGQIDQNGNLVIANGPLTIGPETTRIDLYFCVKDTVAQMAMPGQLNRVPGPWKFWDMIVIAVAQ